MIFRIENLEIDTDAMVLRRAGEIVPLKPRPFAMLEYLVSNPDRIVSKTEIIDAVWGGRIVSDAALATAARDVRRAIGDDAREQGLLRTHYGRGWRFVASADTAPLHAAAPTEGQENPHENSPSTARARSAKLSVSLAILPFDVPPTQVDLTGFGETVAEDLIFNLARYQMLSVVSRTSSFAMREQSMPLSRIGEALNADYVCEGSLRRIGDSVRITVDLIDARQDAHVWADQFICDFDGTEGDLTATIDRIAGKIAVEVNNQEGRIAFQTPYHDLDAWGCYHHALFVLKAQNLESCDEEIIRGFDRAIELDPRFSLARALLAYCLSFSGRQQAVKGIEAADPTIVEADLSRAEAEARRALELEPGCVFAWVALSAINLARGKADQALSAAQSAVERNPRLPGANLLLGRSYLSVGQPEAAIDALDRCIAMGQNSFYEFLSMAYKALALTALGRNEDAIACSREANNRSASAMIAFFGEISALGHLGRTEEARQIIQQARKAYPGLEAGHFDIMQPISNSDVWASIHDGFRFAGFEAGPRASEKRCSAVPATVRDRALGNDEIVLAVLPFRPHASATMDDSHAENLAQDLVTRLSWFRDITVRSLTATQTANGTREDLSQVRQRTNADYIVKGAVESDGTASVQVIDAHDGTLHWTGRFHIAADPLEPSVLTAAAAASTILQTLNAIERGRIQRKPDDALTPYECYFRGRGLMMRHDPSVQGQAIALFKRAITEHPEHAKSHASLSLSMNISADEIDDAPDAQTAACPDEL